MGMLAAILTIWLVVIVGWIVIAKFVIRKAAREGQKTNDAGAPNEPGRRLG